MRIERLNCKEAAAVAQRYACAPLPDTNTQTRKTHETHEQQQHGCFGGFADADWRVCLSGHKMYEAMDRLLFNEACYGFLERRAYVWNIVQTGCLYLMMS